MPITTGAFEGLFGRYGRCRLPLVVHPEAWRERKVVFPTGTELRLPPPSRADLEAEDLRLVEERGQTLLLDDTILVSGQIERVTEFEKGLSDPLCPFAGRVGTRSTRAWSLCRAAPMRA